MTTHLSTHFHPFAMNSVSARKEATIDLLSHLCFYSGRLRGLQRFYKLVRCPDRGVRRKNVLHQKKKKTADPFFGWISWKHFVTRAPHCWIWKNSKGRLRIIASTAQTKKAVWSPNQRCKKGLHTGSRCGNRMSTIKQRLIVRHISWWRCPPGQRSRWAVFCELASIFYFPMLFSKLAHWRNSVRE